MHSPSTKCSRDVNIDSRMNCCRQDCCLISWKTVKKLTNYSKKKKKTGELFLLRKLPNEENFFLKKD